MTQLNPGPRDVSRILGDLDSTGADREFLAHAERHLPRLHELFERLYGDRADGLERLASVVDLARRSWTERPRALKALDREREGNPEWFEGERMLGGVCYVDRYAGGLSGIRDRIPYFRELGLTYLHLMPLFESPEGNSDGGYAVSSYRRVNPALGTMEELASLPPTCVAPASRSSSTSSSTTPATSTSGRGRPSRASRLRGLLPHLPGPRDARRLRADDA